MRVRKGESSATREDDEKRLVMLQMRDKNCTSPEIARALGMTSGGVRATLNLMDREYYRSEGAA